MKTALALGFVLAASCLPVLAQTAPERQGPSPDTSPADPSAPPENVGKPIGDSAAGFTQLDANRDGRVSPTEAKASLELTAEFAAFDGNGDSSLSPEEYEAFVRAPR